MIEDFYGIVYFFCSKQKDNFRIEFNKIYTFISKNYNGCYLVVFHLTIMGFYENPVRLYV